MIGRFLFITILGVILLKQQQTKSTALIVRPTPIAWGITNAVKPAIPIIKQPVCILPKNQYVRTQNRAEKRSSPNNAPPTSRPPHAHVCLF